MHRTLVAIVLLLAALFSLTRCAGVEDGDVEGQSYEITMCPGGDSSTHYFPPGVFASDRPDIDEFNRCFNNWQLSAMEEPSLSQRAAVGEVSYRFLWLRTFHHPVAVRVVRTSDRISLHAVELSGAGGYEPGKVARRQAVALASPDWARLESALAAAQFWNEPATVNRIGFDGSIWIVEGLRGDAYHLVERWSPAPEDAFHKLGLLFLELAGWSGSVEPVY